MTIDVKKLMWDIGCGELTPGVGHYAVTPTQLEALIAAARLQGHKEGAQWQRDLYRSAEARLERSNHPASVNQWLLDDARRYRTLVNKFKTKRIWNHVFEDGHRALGSSIEDVLDAIAAAEKENGK